MLERVFLQLLNMSFTGGIVILAVVLLRLVCPFTLESALSLIRVNPTPLSTDIFTTDTPRVETGLPVVDEAVNGALSERYPETETVIPTPAPEDNVTDTSVTDTPVVPAPDATPSVPDTPVTPLPTLMQIASVVWLCGIAVMAVYSVVSLWRLRRRLVGAMRLKDNVWLADHTNTAFVLGLFRPKIYLPSTVREEEREYILLHEQTHIRHGDHIVRLIAFIVLAVYWFHPLVWVAFLLSTRDMEMACDESVLKTLGPEIRTAYSQSLLSFTTGHRRIAATPLAFGEGDPQSRIRNILNYKKPALWAIIAGVTACCVAAVCLLTTAAPAKQPEESGESSENAESSENTAESEEEIVYTGDETGVWHRITYTAEDGKDTLIEWEFTLEKEGETLWYTLKKWDYVPRSKEVVELLDREALVYGGKTYVATRISDTGRKQGEKDQYGEYALDEGWISGRLIYFPVGDYLRFDSAEGAMEFSRKRELPVELSTLQGEWYSLRYAIDGDKPKLQERRIDISKTDTGVLVEETRLFYEVGGTDYTYNGSGFKMIESTASKETFDIAGDTLCAHNAYQSNFVYDVDTNTLFDESNGKRFGRQRDLPDVQRYRPYLKQWKNVRHWWRDDKEYFSISGLEIWINNLGNLDVGMGSTPYVAKEDVEDDLYDGYTFQYNGKHFAHYGGGSSDAWAMMESETVLNGQDSYNGDTTYHFVLNPEKETLTVTEKAFDGTSTTTVYDTRMSVENGIFEDLGDLSDPTPTTSTTTTTKATTVATVATEKLKLKAEGVLWFTPSGSGKDAELLMAEEQAAELAALLNRQTVEKKAYKGTGDYTFTLGGQHFSVDAGEGWLNLLDEKGASVMKSVKLSAADTKTLNALLADASELKFDDGNVPVPRYLVNIEGGNDGVVVLSTQKGKTMKLPEGYTFTEMRGTEMALLQDENNRFCLWDIANDKVVAYTEGIQSAIKKAGLQNNGEVINMDRPIAGGKYCLVYRSSQNWTTENYVYEIATGQLYELPYLLCKDILTPHLYKNDTYGVGISRVDEKRYLYLMNLWGEKGNPALIASSEKLLDVDCIYASEDFVTYKLGDDKLCCYCIDTGKTVELEGKGFYSYPMNGNAVVIRDKNKAYRLYDMKTGVDITEKHFDQIPLYERSVTEGSVDGVVTMEDHFTNTLHEFRICDWTGKMTNYTNGCLTYVYPIGSDTMYILNTITNELTTVALPDSFVQKVLAKGDAAECFFSPLEDNSYVSLRVN